MFLALFSLLFVVVIAMPIGISAIHRHGSFLDQAPISTAMLATSMPSLWTGLMVQRWLATEPGGFPASGHGGPDTDFIERTRHLMLDVLGEDYMHAARAKGMGEAHTMLHHALKNAAIFRGWRSRPPCFRRSQLATPWIKISSKSCIPWP